MADTLPAWAKAPSRSGVLHLQRFNAGQKTEESCIDTKAGFILGRKGKECDFKIDHKSVSRTHCALALHAEGSVYLIDLSSTHGTFVEGEKLDQQAQVKLKPGTRFSLGTSPDVFVVVERPGSSTQPSRAAGEAGHRERRHAPDRPPDHHRDESRHNEHYSAARRPPPGYDTYPERGHRYEEPPRGHYPPHRGGYRGGPRGRAGPYDHGWYDGPRFEGRGRFPPPRGHFHGRGEGFRGGYNGRGDFGPRGGRGYPPWDHAGGRRGGRWREPPGRGFIDRSEPLPPDERYHPDEDDRYQPPDVGDEPSEAGELEQSLHGGSQSRSRSRSRLRSRSHSVSQPNSHSPSPISPRRPREARAEPLTPSHSPSPRVSTERDRQHTKQEHVPARSTGDHQSQKPVALQHLGVAGEDGQSEDDAAPVEGDPAHTAIASAEGDAAVTNGVSEILAARTSEHTEVLSADASNKPQDEAQLVDTAPLAGTTAPVLSSPDDAPLPEPSRTTPQAADRDSEPGIDAVAASPSRAEPHASDAAAATAEQPSLAPLSRDADISPGGIKALPPADAPSEATSAAAPEPMQVDSKWEGSPNRASARAQPADAAPLQPGNEEKLASADFHSAENGTTASPEPEVLDPTAAVADVTEPLARSPVREGSPASGTAAAAASDPETTKASAAAKAGAEPVGRQVEREEPRRDYSGNPRRDHAYPGDRREHHSSHRGGTHAWDPRGRGGRGYPGGRGGYQRERFEPGARGGRHHYDQREPAYNHRDDYAYNHRDSRDSRDYPRGERQREEHRPRHEQERYRRGDHRGDDREGTHEHRRHARDDDDRHRRQPGARSRRSPPQGRHASPVQEDTDRAEEPAAKKQRKSGFDAAPAEGAPGAGLTPAQIVQQMAYGPGGQLQLSADAKKKLLWGKKPGAPSQDAPADMAVYGANNWKAAEFDDQDEKERFEKLMGVRRQVGALTEAESAAGQGEHQFDEELRAREALSREESNRVLRDVEAQYVAGLRRKDGRTVGLGL